MGMLVINRAPLSGSRALGRAGDGEAGFYQQMWRFHEFRG
jgi:hypothetical protein